MKRTKWIKWHLTADEAMFVKEWLDEFSSGNKKHDIMRLNLSERLKENIRKFKAQLNA